MVSTPIPLVFDNRHRTPNEGVRRSRGQWRTISSRRIAWQVRVPEKHQRQISPRRAHHHRTPMFVWGSKTHLWCLTFELACQYSPVTADQIRVPTRTAEPQSLLSSGVALDLRLVNGVRWCKQALTLKTRFGHCSCHMTGKAEVIPADASKSDITRLHSAGFE